MRYLLDTNTCIRYINASHQSITSKMHSLAPNDISMCDVVRFELYYGAYNSTRVTENLAVVQAFSQEFLSLPFDGTAATICARIRSNLKKKGTPIGAYDLQIAAIALANDLTLVTHNVREFQRVETLKFEDWEAAETVDE